MSRGKDSTGNKIQPRSVSILAFIFAISFLAVMSIPSSVSAAITCPGCQVGDCTCIVGRCSSGLFSVYTNSQCSGDPIFEYTFGLGSSRVQINADTATTYYVQAYCDDGVTKEQCQQVTIPSSLETTTTTEEITTETSTTETGGGTGGGLDMTWIIIAIIIVIAIIAFVVYRLFFAKNKSKTGKTYEELYRKWGGTPRYR